MLKRLRRSPWPWPGVAIDLDFARQRYWWGGAERLTTAFTAYTLNASILDGRGITPSLTVNITLALAGLGTFVPGALAASIYNISGPASARYWFQLDDGTANERVTLLQNLTTPSFNTVVIDGGVSQASIGSGTPGGLLNLRFGTASSWDTNIFNMAVNGAPVAGDVSGTLPTVTTLRICNNTAGSLSPTGSLGRVLLFTATKTPGELNSLSLAMRDSP